MQICILLTLPVGITLLCVHLKQQPQTSSGNESSKGIALKKSARKAYVNVDLELFFSI
jgi:hypothetical protein